ncbi:MAG: transposase [Segetibacter sp.]
MQHLPLLSVVCCKDIYKLPGRNRINVMGAVNAITKEISTYYNEHLSFAPTALLLLLQQLKEQYNDKPIAIVLDNARYQHCFVVKTFANSAWYPLALLYSYCLTSIPL